MRNTVYARFSILDQLLSSSTAPLFLLTGFIFLPVENFALSAQFVFLYGCLASICQAILDEPYQIARKHESKPIDSAEYTSASLILAALITILSFPLSLLITESWKLSLMLSCPVVAMLIQNSKRTWRIENKSWFLLLISDSLWLLSSIILILSARISSDYFLLIAWGIPGIIALGIILDYSDFRKINLLLGWSLLLHFGRRYYYAVLEVTLSGVSMIVAYWTISKYLGDSQIASLRYTSLLFGLSTVIVNKQRVFDLADESIHQLTVTTNRNLSARIKEICAVVVFNFFVLFFVFALLDLIKTGSEVISPGTLLLFVIALDRLSVGLLMSVTVFYKAHKNPKIIAKIRTLVAVTSACSYIVLALIDSNLALVILLGSIPYLLAFVMIYFKFLKVKS